VYAQYGGPAVLTRGMAPTGMSAAQIDFRPFVTLDAGYDTGLNGVSLDANGKPVVASGSNVEITAGVSGLHSWKHTKLGLDYRASFRHYASQSFYDGTDQTLLLSIDHQITRHVTFTLRENAGIYSQNSALPLLQQTVSFDPSTTYVPTNDFFDNRTLYFSTQADLSVQKSTRLSFDLGADGFMTRRRSTALFGVSGAGARGDLQYRLTRRSTIGGGYTYTHYSYTGIFSSTDLHSIVGSYSLGLSRSVEIGAVAGVTFYETKFQRTVPIDPVIAAVICPPPELRTQPCVATQISYNKSHIPNISARISKVVPRGVVYASGGRSVTPGNGLFLTSTATNLNAGYSYTGLKRWSITTGASYSYSDSIGNVVGTYATTSIMASISRQLFPSTHAVFSFNAHKYGSGDFQNYNRWSYSLRAGLGFTPGDFPIRLW
jgi:hypothetical protein